MGSEMCIRDSVFYLLDKTVLLLTLGQWQSHPASFVVVVVVRGGGVFYLLDKTVLLLSLEQWQSHPASFVVVVVVVAAAAVVFYLLNKTVLLLGFQFFYCLQ